MGAPPDLVDPAGAAMRDETRHAALCFGLASAYAGRNVGPGLLPIAGALEASSTEERLLMVLREACIGETVAALEVAEAAAHATDATVSVVLRGIARDEMEHAALGFRFLKWALGTLPGIKRRTVERSLLAALAAELAAPAPASATTEEDTALVRHGMLPEAVSRTVRAKALSDVIAPCVSRLFEAPAGVDGMRYESA